MNESSMNSRATKVDVLVVGGGIVGACVARELQASGRQVLLVERGTIASGCSYANAGWLTPCFAMPLPQPGMFWKSIGWLLDPESPLYIHPSPSPRLARWMFRFLLAMNTKQMLKSIEVLTEISKYSLDFYRDLGTRRPIGFESRGLLMVSGTRAGLDHAELEMDLMSARGINGRKLLQEEILNFEPALKSVVKGGVYFPDEAQTEPYPTTQAVMDEFQALGGKSLTQTEVYEFEVRDRRVTRVRTTQGDFSPELLVMAAGAWSADLAKQVGMRIPILGGKGYSMNIEMRERKPKHPIMIVEKKIAVTPRAESVRLAGTLELVDQNFSISPHRVQAIYRGAQEYMHIEADALAKGPRDVWRGLRPCTPDGVPVIGASKRRSNLFYCMGHQLLGLQSAPGSARLAADLIVGRAPLTDPRPFRAERFE